MTNDEVVEWYDEKIEEALEAGDMRAARDYMELKDFWLRRDTEVGEG